MPSSIDITGQRFGRLTAIRMTVKGCRNPCRSQRWLFRCDCGNEIELAKANVIKENTRSCGCLKREVAAELHTTHGHTTGGEHSSEYISWKHMLDRCRNPNNKRYADYGGRDLTVCERWGSFESFLADMGPKPSPDHEIERRDNDKGYSPENCYWATAIEQANNKRNNRRYTIGDRTQTLTQWAREYSISEKKLRNRIERGWHPELIQRLLKIHRERAEVADVREAG
jgi:hypothetical protein